MRIAMTARAWLRLFAMTMALLGIAVLTAPRGSAQYCWGGNTCDSLPNCYPYQWQTYCDFNCSASCWPCKCQVYRYNCNGTLCADYECVCGI